MKKIIIVIVIVIVLISLIATLLIYKNINNTKRYDQIVASFEDGVKWDIKVKEKYGYKEDSCNSESEEIVKSEYLISQGYLKKKDMLDIDNKTYCSAYTRLKGSKECKYVYDKIYIKCKNYTTKGHEGW